MWRVCKARYCSCSRSWERRTPQWTEIGLLRRQRKGLIPVVSVAIRQWGKGGAPQSFRSTTTRTRSLSPSRTAMPTSPGPQCSRSEHATLIWTSDTCEMLSYLFSLRPFRWLEMLSMNYHCEWWIMSYTEVKCWFCVCHSLIKYVRCLFFSI